MTVNRREIMEAVLAGEKVENIPLWIMGFSGYRVLENIFPPELLFSGCYEYPDKEGDYPFDCLSDEESLSTQLAFGEYMERCAYHVGYAASAAFGHGGPGEFNKKVVERGGNYYVVQYETGALKKIQRIPHNVHTYKLPVASMEDLEALQLPDPENDARYTGFRKGVEFAKKNNQWTIGMINGVFSGAHYFMMDFPEFMVSMLAEPELAEAVIKKVSDWTLAAEKKMCEAGVDCIGFCDDLGSGQSMLISPDLYRKFIKPRHRMIVELAHSNGVKVHMHCHGAIMPILKDIVEIGVDILNPLDPDDKMPFDASKAVLGEKVVMVGGMNKHFFDWDKDTQYQHLKDVMGRGKNTGRFILMDSAGLPDNVTKEQFDSFLELYHAVNALK